MIAMVMAIIMGVTFSETRTIIFRQSLKGNLVKKVYFRSEQMI